jgi:tRNA U55 pseudouridine synthase TruB
MASGKLLVLIGEECKNQTAYHDLDKEYEFSVLFGVTSDTQDVLGRLKAAPCTVFAEGGVGAVGEANAVHGADDEKISDIASSLIGELTVPYPLFSAKTVQGKPLHMWTLERRLDEIEIPTRTSHIYELVLTGIEMLPREEIARLALEKIETIPEVTDPRKALGNDFRRVDVRADWKSFAEDSTLPNEYTIASFRCIASSGSYMRTLATLIAKKLHTDGLAWHIHRTKIGIFDAGTHTWSKEY